MSPRTARRLAAVLTITSLVIVIASIVLLIPNASGRPLTGLGSNGVAGLAVSCTYPIVGWLVASRRPGNPIGWIFLVVGLSQSLEALATQYAIYGLVTDPGSLPFADFVSWVQVWAWVPGFLMLGILVLLFPDGDLPSPLAERLCDEVDIAMVTADLDSTVRSAIKPVSLGLWLREGASR